MRRDLIGVCSGCLVAICMLAIPSAAFACSCFAVAGKRALPFAAAMFTGKATKLEFLAPDNQRNEPPILVTFEVAEVWKGPVRKTLKLRTTYNRWTCSGYYFKEGETYLVTAHQVTSPPDEKDVELAGVNPCGGTREISRAKDVMNELGKGERPSDEAKKSPTRLEVRSNADHQQRPA